jgi:hypothetical protein
MTMKIFLLILISLLLGVIFPNSGMKLKTAVPETDTTFIYLKDFGLRNTKKKDCNTFINEAIISFLS